VPVPAAFVELVGPVTLAIKQPSAYSMVRTAAKRPVTRKALLGLLAIPEVAAAVAEVSELAEFVTMVNDSDIVWDRVESVEDAGRREVFDLEVPDTKVFAVDNGLVVWDTMNYHVAVTDEANQEAIEKMLPSKNLLAVRDFKVHYTPKNEFLLGLYLASAMKKDKSEPRVFHSKKDMLSAYARGDLDIDDRVVVKELK
jgi:hypothetical protein